MSARRLFIILILLCSNITAGENFVTGSINVSKFYDETSRPLAGYSIGIGWEWEKGPSSALLFTPSYLYRGVKLENKAVWNEFGPEIIIMDIRCQISYLDLPLNYRYYLKKKKYYCSVGSSVCLALKDGSDDIVLERIITHYPTNTDYAINIDPGATYILSSSSIDFSISSGIKNKHLDLSAIAKVSVGDVRTIASGVKGVNANFVTLSLQSAWYF